MGVLLLSSFISYFSPFRMHSGRKRMSLGSLPSAYLSSDVVETYEAHATSVRLDAECMNPSTTDFLL